MDVTYLEPTPNEKIISELNQMFSKNLRYLLKQNNVTQTKVSRDLGFSKNWLSNFLRADRTPALSYVKLISDYFNVPLETFYSQNIDQLDNTYAIAKKIDQLNIVRRHNVETYVNNQYIQQTESKIIKISSETSTVDNYKIIGNSMAPLFTHGMTIQVHKDETTNIIDGLYYAIELSGDTYIKQIVISPTQQDLIELHSFNPNYDTTYLGTQQEFTIIGSVHAFITI